MFQSHRATKTIWLLWIALATGLVCAIVQGIAGPGSLTGIGETVAPARTPIGEAVAAAGWYEVYFTDTRLEGYRRGPDEALAAAVDAARLSVDMAVYALDLWSVRDALLAAHRRGVSVRLVTETDNLNREIQQLREAGVPIVDDGRQGLMHNKFVIIDRQEVWTGSMNFTLSGAYRNDNNLLRLRDSQLAAAYVTEFEEMFLADQFGSTSPANTPSHHLLVEGTSLEVYFAPEDEVASRLVELIRGAQQSIYFLAFSFTADELAEAIIARARQGIPVLGVMDAGQATSNLGGDYRRFREAGLDVRLDGGEGRMHHKVLIIDERVVVTGSYNFTRSAERRNDENLLIVHSPSLAAAYLDEFARIFDQARQGK